MACVLKEGTIEGWIGVMGFGGRIRAFYFVDHVFRLQGRYAWSRVKELLLAARGDGPRG